MFIITKENKKVILISYPNLKIRQNKVNIESKTLFQTKVVAF